MNTPQIKIPLLILILFSIGIATKAQKMSTCGSPAAFKDAKGTIEFIENRGQLADQFGKPLSTVAFSSDYNGIKIYVTPSGFHYIFSRSYHSNDNSALFQPNGLLASPHCDSVIFYRLDMQFIASNPTVKIMALEKTDHYYNYYLSQCPEGITGVPSYQSLLYKDLYPGIDMILLASDSGMKYDFIVSPGADPSSIRMRYGGQSGLQIKDNELEITTPFGSIRENELYSFSDNKASNEVASHFEIEGNEVHFKIGEYDKSKLLYIDPTRMWGTYFGGAGDDAVVTIAVSSDTSVTILGGTTSTTGIATQGAHQVSNNGNGDVFVAHYSPNGKLLWSTYYGGSQFEEPHGLGIDNQNNIIFSGLTKSITAIASSNAYQTSLLGFNDFFITKLSPIGIRQWSTYYGGPDTEIGNSTRELAIDSSQNIIITGTTYSTSLIATGNSFQSNFQGGIDGVLAKFSPQGNLLWATYIGNDSVWSGGVACDKSDNIIFAGYTTSTGLGINGFLNSQQSHRDALLMKFTASGAINWSTYYGGSTFDYFLGVSIDRFNNIAVVGASASTSGIATAGAHLTNAIFGLNGCIAKFSGSGNRQWCSYYGTLLIGVDISNFGDIYVTGSGYKRNSSNELYTQDAFSGPSLAIGAQGGVASIFSKDGALEYGTFYGTFNTLDRWNSIVVDPVNNFYFGGFTVSAFNITTPGIQQPNFGGGIYDGALIKFCNIITPKLPSVYDTICQGETDTLTLANSYPHIKWFDNTKNVVSIDDSIRYIIPDTLSPGLHRIAVVVSNENSCEATDSMYLFIRSAPKVNVGPDTTICDGRSLRMAPTISSGKAPYTYLWTPAEGISTITALTPLVTPVKTTTYHLTVTDVNGCVGTDSLTITINDPPIVDTKKEFEICSGTSVSIGDTAIGAAPFIYHWSPATGLTATNKASVTAKPFSTTIYTQTITDKYGCQTTADFKVKILPQPKPDLKPSGKITICDNVPVAIHAHANFSSYRWNDGSTFDSIVVQKSGTYTVTVTDTNGCTSSESVIVQMASDNRPEISGPSTACPNTQASYSVSNTPGSSYNWSLSGGGTITSGNGTNTIAITWTTIGSWKLTVRETTYEGCERDSSVTIDINSNLTPAISSRGPVTLCTGDTVILYTSKGFLNYHWNTGATTDSIIVTTTGDYTVTVTGAGGCEGTSQPIHVTILPDSKPNPVIIASKFSLCNDDSVLLSLSETYATYQWSTGETTPSISIRTPGSYYVTVTNTNGCEGTAKTIAIGSGGVPTIQSSVTSIDFGPTTPCSNRDTTIILSNSGCDTLHISAIQLSGIGFGITDTVLDIPPGESFSIVLHTLTDTSGHQVQNSGSITITSNAQIPLAPITLSRTFNYPKDYSIRFFISNPSGNNQDQVTMQIIADSLPQGLTQLSATLVIGNTDLLSFVDYASPSQVSIAGNTVTITGNPIKTNGNILAELHYRVFLTKDSTTTINFSNISFNNADPDYANCVARVQGAGSVGYNYQFACAEHTIAKLLRGDELRISSINPNPTQGEITITIESPIKTDGVIEVYDVLGKRVLSEVRQLSKGKNSILFDTKSIARGRYSVRLKANRAEVQSAFVKE